MLLKENFSIGVLPYVCVTAILVMQTWSMSKSSFPCTNYLDMFLIGQMISEEMFDDVDEWTMNARVFGILLAHTLAFVSGELIQSGTGRKTFQAKSMPFLEGKDFHLNNFTMDGFSFQLVFSLKIGKFYHPSEWHVLDGKPFQNILFIANLASDRLSDRRVKDVICMFSLHNQAEKSWFYLINLIAI